MDILNYEEFFYETWDQVSFEIVPDKLFDRNQELIREMTFGFYDVYKNTCRIESGYIVSEMSPKRTAIIFEKIFSSIKTIGISV